MGLTPAQQRAVQAQEEVLFVAAGAGSGKTSVLVERYLRLLVEEGIDPGRVASVTFTKKAAGELRQRIRAGLLEQGRHDLAHSIDRAPIGTIHNLCARILRGQGVLHGFRPDFRILDENESEVLAQDAMALAWEEMLVSCAAEDLELLARHARMLNAQALAAFTALRARGQRFPALVVPERADTAVAKAALQDSLASVAGLPASLLTSDTAVDNHARACACMEWLEEAPGEPDTICEAARFLPKMVGAKAKALFGEHREILLQWCRAAGEDYLSRVAVLLARLLSRFSALYQETKAARGEVDFADLEIEALSLLEASPHRLGDPSHLLVDEFQDTNQLQCRLFDALAPSSFTSVGDYHQSIYGFRGADCRVFEARKRRLWEGCSVPEEPSRVWVRPDGGACFVPMTTNFRTRESVLAVIDHLFSSPAFFGSSFSPLEACSGRRVDYPCGKTEPSVEVYALTEPEAVPASVAVPEPTGAEPAALAEPGVAFEPAAVAARIKRLIEEEQWLPGQIALLLRKTVKAAEYEKALRSCGVDCYVVGGRGYFGQQEVSDITSLLTLLVDPHNDLALAAVLRSPLVDLTDDALWLLGRFRKERGRPSLFAALRARDTALLAQGDEAAVARLEAALQEVRTDVGRPGLSGLVERAANSLDYDLVLLSSPEGRRKWANIRKLMALADTFEEIRGPDLAGFLRYVARRGGVSDREAEASVLAEHEDVVRIMSVHQAKGLEFPVVVFAGLGERTREDAPDLLIDDDGTVALRMTLPAKFSALGDRITLGPYETVLQKTRAREREEEARICYVAATRARERLILLGTRKQKARELDKRPLSWFLAALGLAVEEEVPPDHRPCPALDVVCNPVLDRLLAAAAPQTGVEAGGGVRARSQSPVPRPPFPHLRWPPGVTALSFSAIALYRQCPQRFFLERVLGLSSRPAEDIPSASAPPAPFLPAAADEEPGPAGFSGERLELDHEEESSGVQVGILVHKMLELAPLSLEPPHDAAVELIYRKGETATGLHLAPEAATRAQRLFAAFWESPLAEVCRREASSSVASPSPAAAPRHEAEPERRERPAAGGGGREVPFSFAFDGLLVRGVVDRLLRAGEKWVVIDYKTNRLDGRTLGEASAPYELQAGIYGLAGLLAGAQEVTVHLLFLEAPREPVSFTYRSADAAELERRLRAAIEGLVSGDFTGGKTECGVCPHVALCPRR